MFWGQSCLCFLLLHRKIKFILVSFCRFLLQAREPVLLRMVVPRAFNIVGMFLEDAKLRSVSELWALLVVAPVDRVSQRRSHGLMTGVWHGHKKWQEVTKNEFVEESSQKNVVRRDFIEISSWKLSPNITTWTQYELSTFSSGRTLSSTSPSSSPHHTPAPPAFFNLHLFCTN